MDQWAKQSKNNSWIIPQVMLHQCQMVMIWRPFAANSSSYGERTSNSRISFARTKSLSNRTSSSSKRRRTFLWDSARRCFPRSRSSQSRQKSRRIRKTNNYMRCRRLLKSWYSCSRTFRKTRKQTNSSRKYSSKTRLRARTNSYRRQCRMFKSDSRKAKHATT